MQGVTEVLAYWRALYVEQEGLNGHIEMVSAAGFEPATHALKGLVSRRINSLAEFVRIEIR